MRVRTSSDWYRPGANNSEPTKGAIVVSKLANGNLMGFRHGDPDYSRSNKDYHWWRTDKASSGMFEGMGADSWAEILRSGEILAVFYP